MPGLGLQTGSSALQVRGHVSQSRMTIRYAIGKNTTEGMTHMMCIDGTEGERLLRPARAAQTTWAVLGEGGADPPPSGFCCRL